MSLPSNTLAHWQAALARRETTSRALTEAALDAARGGSEAGSTFIAVHAQTARATADAADALRAAGLVTAFPQIVLSLPQAMTAR